MSARMQPNDPVLVSVQMVEFTVGTTRHRVSIEEALRLRNRLSLLTDQLVGMDRTAAIVLDAVLVAFGATPDRILSQNRSEPLATHRHAAMWLLLELGVSDAEAVRLLKKKRTLARHGHHRITDLMSIDPQLHTQMLAMLEQVQAKIQQKIKK